MLYMHLVYFITYIINQYGTFDTIMSQHVYIIKVYKNILSSFRSETFSTVLLTSGVPSSMSSYTYILFTHPDFLCMWRGAVYLV